MKNRKSGRQFGRVRAQRKALLYSLVSGVIVHGRIRTTEAKAKETKNAVDKIITKAKRAAQQPMEMVRKLEGEISPQAIAVLCSDIQRFDTRTSGYTRVIKCVARTSDSARMAIIELVDRAQKKDDAKKSAKKTVAKKTTQENTAAQAQAPAQSDSTVASADNSLT